MENRKIKILLGKTGLDGHDIGIKILARSFRDAGMEVVYLGAFNASEAIVQTAIQEDVDIIGLSFLGGAHLFYVEEAMEQLKKSNITHIPVVVGGVIPRSDIPKLREMGVKGAFESGSDVSEIIRFIRQTVGEKKDPAKIANKVMPE